jgi:hypothetical protein
MIKLLPRVAPVTQALKTIIRKVVLPQPRPPKIETTSTKKEK